MQNETDNLQKAIEVICRAQQIVESIPSDEDGQYDKALRMVMSAAKRCQQVEKERNKLTDSLDLQRDEFKRINALVERDSEIAGLCERAIKDIEQRVPVIVQRDNFEQDRDSLKSKVEELEREKQTMGEQLDHLLAHCKDSECEVCSKIICPHGEPLHFHHDGCPCCVTYEDIKQERTPHTPN